MAQQSSRSLGEGADPRIARGLIVLVVAVILVGFAKNFYLREWLGTRPLILTAWVHGAVMTAWLTLFVTQVTLVIRGRVDLHRRLGQWGVWLAVAVVAVGMVTIVVRSKLLYPAATPATAAAVFVAFDGLSLLLFGALVALAWRYRARPPAHRRLMMMAMTALLPPALGRLVAYLRHDHIEIAVLGLMVVITVTVVSVDALRSHRIQPASWIPGVLILGVNVATYFAQISG